MSRQLPEIPEDLEVMSRPPQTNYGSDMMLQLSERTMIRSATRELKRVVRERSH